MTTLHIEHRITDHVTWKRAFDGFAGMRAAAGIRSHLIRRPIDDPRYFLIELDSTPMIRPTPSEPPSGRRSGPSPRTALPWPANRSPDSSPPKNTSRPLDHQPSRHPQLSS